MQTKNSVPKLTLLRNGEGIFEVATANDHKQSSKNSHKEAAIQRKHKGRHWTCQICQRKFNTEDAKDLHESKHDLMKFKCPDPCPNMFINFSKLRAHTKKKHHFILTHINKEMCRVSDNITAVEPTSHPVNPAGEPETLEPLRMEQQMKEILPQGTEFVSVDTSQDSEVTHDNLIEIENETLATVVNVTISNTSLDVKPQVDEDAEHQNVISSMDEISTRKPLSEPHGC